jgi:hypothetical protein
MLTTDEYENAELEIRALEATGVDNWEGYDIAQDLYEEWKQEDIDKVNERIDKVNDILLECGTPSKVSALIFGLVGMMTDPSVFAGKVLMLLDDKSLDMLHKDFVPEAREANLEK